MKIHDSGYSRQCATLAPDDLRREFLVEGLFRAGEANFRYWGTDRTVLGGISPLDAEIALRNPPGLRSAFFLERREAGVINLGGPGHVRVDGAEQGMETLDTIYLGRGVKAVTFASSSVEKPARFYLLSYPAHTAYPVRHIGIKQAKGDRLGSREGSNERVLHKIIHPGAFPTCQLVMGFTRLEPGSVWNSMPPHTHLRRSEVYLYFDLPPEHAVFHIMGEPQATRSLVVRNLEAVLSPPWSVHCGAGTSNYTFVWGMGGENQEFADMDPASISTLR